MGTVKYKQYKEIADENLQVIIEKDLGRSAKLLSWESYYFTKIGENFLGKVKGVHCEVSVDEKQFVVSYVVKLNPRRQLELFKKMTHSFFVKEGKYLFEVLPILNSILRNAHVLSLSVPECLFVSYQPEEEIILLKDLRVENYKMHDRMAAMDINHLLLSVEELAKQHSSSYIYHLQKGKKSLTEIFPYMEDLWLDQNNEGASQYINYCKMRISSTIKVLEEFKSHPKALDWIKRNEDSLFDTFVAQWKKTDSKYKVVCHGDCWTNNMLFKYNEEDEGLPSKVILLDFQQCKIGSLVTDLHILFITTTDGETRRNCIDQMLQSYYKTFNSVCKGSGRYTPFTLDELKQEFKSKAIFGFLSGILRLPLLLNDSEDDILDFNKMDAETYLKFIEEQKINLSTMLNTKQNVKERYFSVFDTASEYGLF